MKKTKNIVLVIIIWSSCLAIFTCNQTNVLEYKELKDKCLENNLSIKNISPGFFSFPKKDEAYLQVLSRYVYDDFEFLNIEVASKKKLEFTYFIIREKECRTFLI